MIFLFPRWDMLVPWRVGHQEKTSPQRLPHQKFWRAPSLGILRWPKIWGSLSSVHYPLVMGRLFRGSLNRWDRWYIIPQLAIYTTYIPTIGSICHLYTTYILPIGLLYATDPTYFPGTRFPTIEVMDFSEEKQPIGDPLRSKVENYVPA